MVSQSINPSITVLALNPISFSAPAETAEEAVGTVEEDQPAATTDDATVAESTASVDTASKTRVNTLVSLVDYRLIYNTI